MEAVLSTKEKIVALGRGFMQDFGYHSFKYQQIATALNIKNAAIHHYFPSKEDLGVAIIKKDHADFLQTIEKSSNESATFKSEILLNAYSSYFKEDKNLCIVGACSSAFNEIPQRMQEESKKYFDTILTWLAQVFKEGLDSGEFKFDKNPENLAALWTATLMGSLQLAKINGPEYFNVVISQLRASYI